MTSTGNDIVALKAIDITRTNHPRFYSKIISSKEKKFYDKQVTGKMPFEVFVWLTWSLKEAAFKFLQRINPELVFSPTKITIQYLEFPPGLLEYPEERQLEGCDFVEGMVYKGIVGFGSQTLYSRSVIHQDFIASVVSHEDDFKNTFWAVQQIASAETSDQSRSVREFLLNRLNKLFPGADFQIDKSARGYPMLLNGKADTGIPVSLAHHDHFIAYSFELNSKS